MADFYAARSNTISPPQWTSFAPPFTTALQSWFHGFVTVDLEDRIGIGRIDVRLMLNSENSNVGKVYWTIIELKIVKGYRNTKNAKTKKEVKDPANINAIVEGFSQADNFSIDREVPEGFLEIFDMRKKKTKLLDKPKVQKAIKRCNAQVNYKLRCLYGSAQHARQAGYEFVPSDND